MPTPHLLVFRNKPGSVPPSHKQEHGQRARLGGNAPSGRNPGKVGTGGPLIAPYDPHLVGT